MSFITLCGCCEGISELRAVERRNVSHLDEDIEDGEVPAGVPPHQILDRATVVSADRGAAGHVALYFPPLLMWKKKYLYQDISPIQCVHIQGMQQINRIGTSCLQRLSSGRHSSSSAHSPGMLRDNGRRFGVSHLARSRRMV